MYTIIRILGNRYAGFILAMLMVINLAIGSLVMNIDTELYPPFFPFDLNFFFRPVMAIHSWLYALLVTFTLFGINLFFCLIESVVRLVNSKTGRRRQIAALLIHLALLLTMLAHLQDGFDGRTEQIMLSSNETVIDGLGAVRVSTLTNIPHPDGSLKDTEVLLHINSMNGATSEQRIAYNEPAIFDEGKRELIIQGGDNQPAGIALERKSDQQEIRLEPNVPFAVESGHMVLMGVYQSQMGMLIAQLGWQLESDQHGTRMIVLDANAGIHNKFQLAGETYQYKAIFEVPVLAAQYRYNPSIPLILNALVAASIGLLLLMRSPRRQSA